MWRGFSVEERVVASRNKNKDPEQEIVFEKVVEDLRLIMTTRQGQDFVWYILSQCGIYSDNFTGDRQKTDYLLGQRSIGLMVLGLMQDADPAMYAELQLRKAKDGTDQD